MKDGGIDQIGTPEDLVVRPATDYVAEFTKDVSRAKVLSVASVMTSVSEAAPRAATAVKCRSPRRSERSRAGWATASSPSRSWAVTDKQVGQVTRDAVIGVLIQG